MKAEVPAVVIADANVLIDYAISNPEILKLVSSHLWEIRVPSSVFDEVDQIDRSNADSLGITIIYPSLAQIMEASIRGGRLSSQDRLCFIVARDNGWRCWTNDFGLRKL